MIRALRRSLGVELQGPGTALDEAPGTRHFAGAFEENGDIVGCLRMHDTAWTNAGVGSDLLGELRVQQVSGYRVLPSFRHTVLPFQLFEAVYERARTLSCDALAVEAEPGQVMMYEALGFFRFSEGYAVQSGRFLIPMLLHLDDVAYLSQVGSPLYDTAKRYLSHEPGGASLPRKLEAMSDGARPPRNAVVTGTNDPDAGLDGRLLEQLDEFRIGGILRRTLRQTVPRGTRLDTLAGSGAIHLLVSGNVGLIPVGSRHPMAYLERGDVIAEGSLARQELETTTRCMALTECTLVTLSRDDLETLTAADPVLAAQLLYRMVTGLARRVDRSTRLLVHDRAPGPRTMLARARVSMREPEVKLWQGE